eukprot:gene10492-2622_t
MELQKELGRAHAGRGSSGGDERGRGEAESITHEINKNANDDTSGMVVTSHAVLEQHSHDESYHPPHQPDAVIYPETVEHVSTIMKICNKYNVPMIPFGTGTGLESGVSAPRGGICIDLTRMDKIIDVNTQDATSTVEPGVTRKTLNTHLRDTGLWFPIDPGADASLCGMCATGASGTTAVRYGTMKHNVLNLQVVLADGRIMYTAGPKGRAPKSSAGLNLTNLFVGSEGTLGIITAATLRLQGQPEFVASAVCSFDSVEQAAETAMQIMQCNIPIARMELLDDAMMHAFNTYKNSSNYAERPHLFLEFHGFSQPSLDEQVAFAQEIAVDLGGQKFLHATALEERNRLWESRHHAWYAALSLRKGCKGYSTDVCVPISKLPEMVHFAKEKIAQLNLIAPIAGHVGDGNFHCIAVFNHHCEDEVARVKQLSSALAIEAINLGGTCTGEHGIGIGKKEFLETELGTVNVEAMCSIKRALDPKNLLNPTKLYPLKQD